MDSVYHEQRLWFSTHVYGPSKGMTAIEALAERDRWAAIVDDRSKATDADNDLIVNTSEVLQCGYDYAQAVDRILDEWIVAADARSDEEWFESPEGQKDSADRQRALAESIKEKEAASHQGELQGAKTLLNKGDNWNAYRALLRIASSGAKTPEKAEAQKLISEMKQAGTNNPPLGSVWEKRASRKEARRASRKEARREGEQ